MPTLRLAVLDVDGTLKQAESPYQFLHERLGVAHLAGRNRELALTGEISMAEWLYRDVALWAGQPVELIQTLLAENPYLPGAPDLLQALKRAGVVVALVSSGFTLNTDPIVAGFGLDHALANQLCVAGGRLDGKAINRVDPGDKRACLRRLMAQTGAPAALTLVAGDTQGDIELFDDAGLCWAVNPRSPALRVAADVVFEPDLTGAVEWLVERGYLPATED